MFIIPRYILRAHIGPFLFGTVTVMFIFLLQFLMRYIDQLVGKGLSTWTIIQLVALNLAWMVVLAVPMGVLFAAIMAFGAMSAAHEVTIIKSSGASLVRMMFPVIIAGTLLTALLFWFNDRVLPDANHRAKILLSDITRTKPTFNIEKGQFSTQLEGYTILSRNIDSTTGALLGVTIYDYTQPQRINVVSADTGYIQFAQNFTKFVIRLTNGEIHQVNQRELGDYRKISFARHRIVSNAEGFGFMKSEEGAFSRGEREMRIADMKKIVETAEKSAGEANTRIRTTIDRHINFLLDDSVQGRRLPVTEAPPASKEDLIRRVQSRISVVRSTLESDVFQRQDYESQARQYQVEIDKKYAIPFACLVFVLVGCPLGVVTRGGNFGISAAISLAFFIFYWACLIGGEKLADRGLVTPFTGMWIGNFCVGIMGIILMLRVNNENRRGFLFAFMRRIIPLERLISYGRTAFRRKNVEVES